MKNKRQIKKKKAELESIAKNYLEENNKRHDGSGQEYLNKYNQIRSKIRLLNWVLEIRDEESLLF